MASKYVVVDNCPVPAKLAEEIRTIKKNTGAVLQSCYRGRDAEALLKRLGKQSQSQLYQGFIQGRPGYNPANPPGHSTHELYNDGVAYSGPSGMRLRYWQVGMDWDVNHVQDVVREAARLGFTASVTYPTSIRERQHVNFRKEPIINLFKNLKEGMYSPRVVAIRRHLAYIPSPKTHKPYLPSPEREHGKQTYFDHALERAIKQFQKDHGQHVDGIYGIQTARQLNTSARYHKNKAKKKK